MKKAISILVVLLTLSAMPMSALAHGHCRAQRTYRVCAVQACRKTINHRHRGTTYRAHYYGDGHSYHKRHH